MSEKRIIAEKNKTGIVTDVGIVAVLVFLAIFVIAFPFSVLPDEPVGWLGVAAAFLMLICTILPIRDMVRYFRFDKDILSKEKGVLVIGYSKGERRIPYTDIVSCKIYGKEIKSLGNSLGYGTLLIETEEESILVYHVDKVVLAQREIAGRIAAQ
ncbi:MAG: hypothetical protein ACI4U2_03265 [Christensenellaceae bacterium]